MQMVNKSTNDCLANQSTNQGLITHATYFGSDSQKVTMSVVPGGYEVTFKNSNQQLDVANGQLSGGTADGQLICQYPFWGGTNEVWMPVPTGNSDRTFYLAVESTNFNSCLTISPSTGTLIQQTCSGLDAQMWQLR